MATGSIAATIVIGAIATTITTDIGTATTAITITGATAIIITGTIVITGGIITTTTTTDVPAILKALALRGLFLSGWSAWWRRLRPGEDELLIDKADADQDDAEADHREGAPEATDAGEVVEKNLDHRQHDESGRSEPRLA